MAKVLELFLKIILATLGLFAIIFILLLGYIGVNIIFFDGIIIPFVKTDPNEIIKEAVTYGELEGKSYIVCKSAAVTGYNYELIRDENGKRTTKYVLVSDIDFGGVLTYEFIISDNTFIFYIVRRIDHLLGPDNDLGEPYTEYIVDGWDILYPVKHDEMPVTSCPKYILKSDYSKIR